MNKPFLFLLVVLLSMGFFSRSLWADIVHLNNGNQMEGKIVEENDESVRLQMRVGTLAVAKSEIARIEKKEYLLPEENVAPPAEKPPAESEQSWRQKAAGFLQLFLEKWPSLLQFLQSKLPALVFAGILFLSLIFLFKKLFKRQSYYYENKSTGSVSLSQEEALQAYIRALPTPELLKLIQLENAAYKDPAAAALAHQELKRRNVVYDDNVKPLSENAINQQGIQPASLPLEPLPKRATLGIVLKWFFLMLFLGAAVFIYRERSQWGGFLQGQLGPWVEKGKTLIAAKGESIPGVSALTRKAESGPVKSYPWYSGGRGYQAALKIHRETGTPMLVYFYTTWCPYCRIFDQKVLASEKVNKALRGVLKVRVDAEQDKDLAAEYQVSGIPRVFALRKSFGSSKASIRTTGSPDEFIKECRRNGLG